MKESEENKEKKESEENKEIKQIKQIIIIGNGFDINCGLQSSYKDFFKWRFDILKKTTEFDDKLKEIENHFNNEDNYNSEYLIIAKTQDISLWDFIFWYAKDCFEEELEKWKDVEDVIYSVVSIALISNSYAENIRFKHKTNVSDPDYDYDIYKKKFLDVLSYITGKNALKKVEIAENLLTSLHVFEEKFADFIEKKSKDEKYIEKVIETFKDLVTTYYDGTEVETKKEILVVSFNYSLDSYMVMSGKENKHDFFPEENVKLASWRNIHGLASYKKYEENTPAPLFGIDDTDIINKKDDIRILFTKSFRMLDNEVNNISASGNYSDADVITIYGHSLGRADYSYFEAIFDKCNLYNSSTVLQINYYPGNKDEFDSIQKAKRQALCNVIKLLTDYGKSIGEVSEKNIVNRLMMENRLELVPTWIPENLYKK